MKHNNRVNPDWQFRCALLPAGYANRCASFGSAKRGVGAWQRIARSTGKPPVTLSDHFGVV